MCEAPEQIFCACRFRVCSKIEGERIQPTIFKEVLVMRRSSDLD